MILLRNLFYKLNCRFNSRALFLIGALFPVLAIGQVPMIELIDQKTEEPIPFALITWQHSQKGTYSDELGSLQPEGLEKGDTLVITHLSYIPMDVVYDGNPDFQIKLVPKDHHLNEVVIFSNDLNVKYPKKMKSKGVFRSCASYNYILARKWMPQDGDTVQVASVRVFIGRGGVAETPFRIRIFKINEDNNLEDILRLPHTAKASANKQWVEIPLMELLYVSEEIWVGVEWLNSGKEEYRYKDVNDYDCFGQSIGMREKNEEEYVMHVRNGVPWVDTENIGIPMIDIGWSK